MNLEDKIRQHKDDRGFNSAICVKLLRNKYQRRNHQIRMANVHPLFDLKSA